MGKISLYDPTGVSRYHGAIFVTVKDSWYGITDNGLFTGKPLLEGAPVALIAGIEPAHKSTALMHLDPKRPDLHERFDDYILEVGQEPKEGLHLILSFRPAPAQGDELYYGIVSSLIGKIEGITSSS